MSAITIEMTKSFGRNRLIVLIAVWSPATGSLVLCCFALLAEKKQSVLVVHVDLLPPSLFLNLLPEPGFHLPRALLCFHLYEGIFVT